MQAFQKYKKYCTAHENKNIDIEGENSLATIFNVIF
jgi:hypothetical protein